MRGCLKFAKLRENSCKAGFGTQIQAKMAGPGGIFEKPILLAADLCYHSGSEVRKKQYGNVGILIGKEEP